MYTAPLVCAPTTLLNKNNKRLLLQAHALPMPEDVSDSVTNMYTAVQADAPTDHSSYKCIYIKKNMNVINNNRTA